MKKFSSSIEKQNELSNKSKKLFSSYKIANKNVDSKPEKTSEFVERNFSWDEKKKSESAEKNCDVAVFLPYVGYDHRAPKIRKKIVGENSPSPLLPNLPQVWLKNAFLFLASMVCNGGEQTNVFFLIAGVVESNLKNRRWRSKPVPKTPTRPRSGWKRTEKMIISSGVDLNHNQKSKEE